MNQEHIPSTEDFAQRPPFWLGQILNGSAVPDAFSSCVVIRFYITAETDKIKVISEEAAY